MSEGLDKKSYQGPEEMAHRSKKNTKKWCKGKPGVEHVPVISKPPNVPGWQKEDCRLDSWGLNFFLCDHHEICSTCFKSLRWPITQEECPTWQKSQSGIGDVVTQKMETS